MDRALVVPVALAAPPDTRLLSPGVAVVAAPVDGDGMTRQTPLESRVLVVPGVRSELRLEGGQVVIHKEATTQAEPTEVSFEVARVRAVTIESPPRGGVGWLHVAVVGGSPPPPGGLAATGDPYTLPLAARGVSAARKLVKLVERHVQERGLPSDPVVPGARSTGLLVGSTGSPSPKAPLASERPETVEAPAPSPSSPSSSPPSDPDVSEDLVARLRELADLHAAGALTDEEFTRAKARIIG